MEQTRGDDGVERIGFGIERGEWGRGLRRGDLAKAEPHVLGGAVECLLGEREAAEGVGGVLLGGADEAVDLMGEF